jgi:hypothetical protein
MAYNLLQMQKKYVERSGLESSGSREVSGCPFRTKKCNNFLTKSVTIIYLSSSITLLNKTSELFPHEATFPAFTLFSGCSPQQYFVMDKDWRYSLCHFLLHSITSSLVGPNTLLSSCSHVPSVYFLPLL